MTIRPNANAALPGAGVFARIWDRLETLPTSIFVAGLGAILLVKVGTWVMPNIRLSLLVAMQATWQSGGCGWGPYLQT